MKTETAQFCCTIVVIHYPVTTCPSSQRPAFVQFDMTTCVRKSLILFIIWLWLVADITRVLIG